MLSKILVMEHRSRQGCAVNVTDKMNQHLFFEIQFLRQTAPHHIQLVVLMKRSGIIVVMDHGERD